MINNYLVINMDKALLQPSTYINSFKPYHCRGGGYYCDPHFTDTEVQRGNISKITQLREMLQPRVCALNNYSTRFSYALKFENTWYEFHYSLTVKYLTNQEPLLIS